MWSSEVWWHFLWIGECTLQTLMLTWLAMKVCFVPLPSHGLNIGSYRLLVFLNQILSCPVFMCRCFAQCCFFLLDLKENCESLYWTEANFFLSFTQSTHLYFLVLYWKPQYHFPHNTNIPITLSIAPRKLLIDCKHKFIAKWLQLY